MMTTNPTGKPVKKTPTVKKTTSTKKVGNTMLIPSMGRSSSSMIPDMAGRSAKKGASVSKAQKGKVIKKTKVVKKTKSPTWYKEGKYKKAYDESAFQDDIDRNKQPYPADIDMMDPKDLKPVKKKMKNGGSLTGLNASKKRMGPVDPKGAFTKVQKKTLAGSKGTASLTKDKQLGATKMAKKGMNISKKK